MERHCALRSRPFWRNVVLLLLLLLARSSFQQSAARPHRLHNLATAYNPSLDRGGVTRSVSSAGVEHQSLLSTGSSPYEYACTLSTASNTRLNSCGV